MGASSTDCSMFQLCRSFFTHGVSLLVQSVAPLSCAMKDQQQEHRAVTSMPRVDERGLRVEKREQSSLGLKLSNV